MKLETLLGTLDITPDDIVSTIPFDVLKTLDISGIAYDSRKVLPGFIFVAIQGALTDGHRYLAEAEKSGALVAVVEQADAAVPLPQIQVKSSRRALSGLSAAWFGYPARDMVMTGITGSNGKTTTAMMLDTIFSVNRIAAGMVGTIFYRIGDKIESADLTTPESLELQGILRAQADYGFTRSIMEVSSISSEQCRVADIVFDVMAFNNVTREHIDQHGSFEAYLDAKTSLMTRLPASSIAVIGADDPQIMARCGQLAARTISFGLLNKDADVCASGLDLSTGVASFQLEIRRPLPTLGGRLEPITVPVKLQVAGLNSVYNALSAMTMALVQGIAPEQAAAGIAAYTGVERRFQRVFNGAFQIYDDHFGNAGNIRMSLQTIERMDKKKLHLAFAVRGNRGVTINREIAEELARWRDKLPWGSLIVTMSRDVTTPKDDVKQAEADVLLDTLERAGYAFTVVDTLQDAVEQIVAEAEPGDVVILGGAQGMDPGARFALKYLLKRDASLDEAAVMAPLDGRICG